MDLKSFWYWSMNVLIVTAGFTHRCNAVPRRMLMLFWGGGCTRLPRMPPSDKTPQNNNNNNNNNNNDKWFSWNYLLINIKHKIFFIACKTPFKNPPSRNVYAVFQKSWLPSLSLDKYNNVQCIVKNMILWHFFVTNYVTLLCNKLCDTSL